MSVDAQHSPTVLDEVERFVERFFAFPSRHYTTVIVLWIVHTWTLEAFYVSPRLVIDSAEPGSGKTRVLEVLAILCRSARMTISTTAAALYRRIANSEEPPTVLQDEADAIFGRANKPEHEDLRALYNSGYKRGATVDRCETVGKAIVVKEFPVFAPVALAGLAGKMPATILDRAVVLHMRKRAPDEEVAEFRDRDANLRAAPIRDRLEAWAAENFDALEAARPSMPEGVRDRPAEVWEALLAVADAAGGHWPQRARAACGHFVLRTDPDALSLGVRLLRDLRLVFGDRDRMFSADIITDLTTDEEMEWSNLWGKPIDQVRLAKELRRYGIRPNTIRIGEGRAKGYQVDGDEGLGQAWRRYLPSIPPRDTRDSGDIAGDPVTGNGHTRDTRDTPVTQDMPTEQGLFSNVPDVTGVTATDGTVNRKGAQRNGFSPPKGNGRCAGCGWHIESMGHADGCTVGASK